MLHTTFKNRELRIRNEIRRLPIQLESFSAQWF
jgi:hypothetical protein